MGEFLKSLGSGADESVEDVSSRAERRQLKSKYPLIAGLNNEPLQFENKGSNPRTVVRNEFSLLRKKPDDSSDSNSNKNVPAQMDNSSYQSWDNVQTDSAAGKGNPKLQQQNRGQVQKTQQGVGQYNKGQGQKQMKQNQGQVQQGKFSKTSTQGQSQLLGSNQLGQLNKMSSQGQNQRQGIGQLGQYSKNPMQGQASLKVHQAQSQLGMYNKTQGQMNQRQDQLGAGQMNMQQGQGQFKPAGQGQGHQNTLEWFKATKTAQVQQQISQQKPLKSILKTGIDLKN